MPTTTPTRSRSRVVDVVLTNVFFLVHLAVFLATSWLIAFAPMTTDPCAYVDCGDEAWIERAVYLVWFGGLVLLAVDLAVSGFRLVRRRVAAWVPVVGTVAHLGITLLALQLVDLAGPLNQGAS